MKYKFDTIVGILVLVCLLVIPALLSGCGGTLRLDGGQSAAYGKDTDGMASGKETVGPSMNLLGLVQLWSWRQRSGLEYSSDEPTMGLGTAIASDTAAASLSAEMVRTNGSKHVKYGATDFKSKAQEVQGILEEVNKIKAIPIPALPDAPTSDSTL